MTKGQTRAARVLCVVVITVWLLCGSACGALVLAGVNFDYMVSFHGFTVNVYHFQRGARYELTPMQAGDTGYVP